MIVECKIVDSSPVVNKKVGLAALGLFIGAEW
jgi:hypothetical protein